MNNNWSQLELEYQFRTSHYFNEKLFLFSWSSSVWNLSTNSSAADTCEVVTYMPSFSSNAFFFYILFDYIDGIKWVYSLQNLNKLSMKYQSYPKSIQICTCMAQTYWWWYVPCIDMFWCLWWYVCIFTPKLQHQCSGSVI